MDAVPLCVASMNRRRLPRLHDLSITTELGATFGATFDARRLVPVSLVYSCVATLSLRPTGFTTYTQTRGQGSRCRCPWMSARWIRKIEDTRRRMEAYG